MFRSFAILLVACFPMILIAEEQRTLDPAKPVDAVQIIHILTEKWTGPRDQAIALTRAIETLAKLAQESAAPAPSTVPVPPAPTEAPKGKP